MNSRSPKVLGGMIRRPMPSVFDAARIRFELGSSAPINPGIS